MSTSTITAKGQITIPKRIRDALNLHRGDQVVFVVEGERAFVQPVRRKRLSSLYGIARGRAQFTSRSAEREAARALAARNAMGAE